MRPPRTLPNDNTTAGALPASSFHTWAPIVFCTVVVLVGAGVGLRYWKDHRLAQALMDQRVGAVSAQVSGYLRLTFTQGVTFGDLLRRQETALAAIDGVATSVRAEFPASLPFVEASATAIRASWVEQRRISQVARAVHRREEVALTAATSSADLVAATSDELVGAIVGKRQSSAAFLQALEALRTANITIQTVASRSAGIDRTLLDAYVIAQGELVKSEAQRVVVTK
jgi:hypothetical protein